MRPFLLCLVLVSACGQVPDVATSSLRQDLASDDAATLAWAAYDAGRRGGRQFEPELRAALERLAAVEGDARQTDEHRATVSAVLDALIRTGADLPPDELTPWWSRRPTEAIVLAAHAPGRHTDLLLPIVEDNRELLYWTAAANLLLAASPDTFVSKLLDLARVRLEVCVTGHDPRHWRDAWGPPIGIGCGSCERLAGFPPGVHYDLHLTHELRAGQAATCFADGPMAVSYERREYTTGTGVGCQTRSLDRVDYALRCLYRLAGRDTTWRLHGRVEETVWWTDAAALRTEVHEIERRLITEWSALLDDLAARSLVSRDFAQQTPLYLVRRMKDWRSEEDRAEPLPVID